MASRSAWAPPGGSFDVDGKRERIVDLERQASDPSLWDDPAKGQRITSSLARLKAELARFDALQRKLDDAVAIDELLSDANDDELATELDEAVAALEGELEKVE